MTKFTDSKPIKWLKEHWQGLLSGFIVTCLAIFTLSLQINSLIDGQNQFEAQTVNNISSLEFFKQNAVNAPYYLPAFILNKIIDDPLLSARLISVFYGLISTAILFLILKRWFNTRTASIGSLLFITSAWLLSIAHQAMPLILLVFAPLLLTLCLTRYVNDKQKPFLAFLLLIFSIGLSAYVPYMIWVILASFMLLLFVYRKKLVAINSNGLLIASVLMLLLLAPLAYSLYQNPEQIKILLGIPDTLPTISEYFSRFVKQFGALFVYTESLPELFIATKPLLDVFSAVMMVLGIYHFVKFMPKKRVFTVLPTAVLLLILIPLQSQYLLALTAILPFVYIFIPAGIHEMMRRWYYVFPRNPFARTTAAVILVTVVGISVTYNLQKFYVAWPNTPETKAVYMIKSKE
jgi:4-amino-4-deoxy-L-arabinose transferase-like glycosyltransferase